MKYPTLLMHMGFNPDGTEYVAPGVFDLDINTMERFYKNYDNFTMIKYKNEKGYYKIATSFWEFLAKIKQHNNIDMSIEDLVKMYDKDSLDDMLLNGI